MSEKSDDPSSSSLVGIESNHLQEPICDLIERVEKTKQDIAYICLENELIERFLQKHNPELLTGIIKTCTAFTIKRIPKIVLVEPKPSANQIIPIDDLNQSSFNPAPSRTSSNKISFAQSRTSSCRTLDSMLQSQSQVNLTMKIEMTERECSAVKLGQLKIEQKAKKRLARLTASVKELQLTNKELDKTMHDLQEYVHIRGLNAITKKVPLERFITFTEMWMKTGNTLIEKMRLKTTTLRQNCFHQKSALAIKAELSGILRPVDFEQLQIEKRRFLQTIDEKNTQFIGMKKVAGNINQALAAQKKSLKETEDILIGFIAKKDKINEDCRRFEKEGQIAEKEIDEWQEKIERLQEEIDVYRAPTAYDYMSRKIELQTVQKEVKAMQRKENILRIKLKNARNRLRQKKEMELARRRKEASMEDKFKNIAVE